MTFGCPPFYSNVKERKVLVSILLRDTEMQLTLTALNTRGQGHLVTLPKVHLG